MRYLLNSAVVTAPGDYRYRLLTPAEARAWYSIGPVVPTIGYAETAAALGELLGASVAVDKRAIAMQPGDEALVFRLALPPGSARIDPADKGRLGREILAGHFELGLLARPRSPQPRDDVALAREALASVWPLVRGAGLDTLTLTREQVLAVRSACALLAAAHGLTREF